MKRFYLAACFIIFSGLFGRADFLFAQSVISYNGSGNFMLRERTDLRRYDNGKYIGLVSREVSSFIIPAGTENGFLYEGSFFVHQGTMRAMQSVAPQIDQAISSVFTIGADGQFKMIEDNGWPSFRSFPTFPNKSIKIGDSWTGKAVRAVDPLDKGVVTRIPFYVQYTYQKDDFLNGEPVFVLSAKWATRYGMGSGTTYIDYSGDRELSRAEGSHNATIYVSKASGNMLLMRDSVNEFYVYSDGNKYEFKGTVALFTEYPPAIDRTKIYRDIRRMLAKTSDSEGAADFSRDSDSDKKSKALTKANSGKADSGKSDSDKLSSDISSLADKSSKSSKSTESAEKLVSGVEDIFDNNKDTDAKKNLAIKEKNPETNNSDFEKVLEEDLAIGELPSVKKADDNSESLEEVIPEKEYIEEIDCDVEETAAGIKLAIRNLQFKPNSPELEDDETSRLDQIAEVLKLNDARLLVEGHTARIGDQSGEQELSEDRARAVAQALSERGVKIGRFICKGWGGKKPIDTNDTTEGRARNRRVEITILD